MKKYPFPREKKITFAQAVNLIAEVLYPDEDQKKAGNRVRQRVRDSGDINTGDKAPEWNSKNPFTHFDFFAWALKAKGWGKLSSIEGLPVSFSICATAPRPTASLTWVPPPIDIPGDYDELRWMYAAAELELRKLRPLPNRVAELEQELAEVKAAWAAEHRRKGTKHPDKP